MGAFTHSNAIRQLAPFTLEERFGPPDGSPLPTPSETMLAALGSCLGARIHANAASANIVVRSLALDVQVDVPGSTMWEPPGTSPNPVGFEAIRVAVHMDADSSPDALRALISHALLWSPVANTLHDPVHLDVSLGRTGGGADSAVAEPAA